MAESAKVNSLEAIKSIRSALAVFIDEAGQSLRATSSEIEMTRNWFRDQLRYWKGEVEKGREEVEFTKTELHRKRVSRSIHDPPADAEYKLLVRQAQRKLDEAEDMVEVVKKWEQSLVYVISQYEGSAAPLADRLNGDLTSALFQLDRMLDALDKYINLAAPEGPSIASRMTSAPVGSDSTTSVTAAESEKAKADETKTEASSKTEETKTGAAAATDSATKPA
jgi:hypothetical protein